jgi:hypothetical protein
VTRFIHSPNDSFGSTHDTSVIHIGGTEFICITLYCPNYEHFYEVINERLSILLCL